MFFAKFEFGGQETQNFMPTMQQLTETRKNWLTKKCGKIELYEALSSDNKGFYNYD